MQGSDTKFVWAKIQVVILQLDNYVHNSILSHFSWILCNLNPLIAKSPMSSQCPSEACDVMNFNGRT